MLDLKIDPNLQDKNGRTPLHIGCKRGNFYGVEAFFKKYDNIDCEIKSFGGETPLFFAVFSGSRTTVKHCLQNGCFPFTFNNVGISCQQELAVLPR